jgi:hypothetical protein
MNFTSRRLADASGRGTAVELLAGGNLKPADYPPLTADSRLK